MGGVSSGGGDDTCRLGSNTYPVTGILWDVVWGKGGGFGSFGGNKVAAEPRLLPPRASTGQSNQSSTDMIIRPTLFRKFGFSTSSK